MIYHPLMMSANALMNTYKGADKANEQSLAIMNSANAFNAAQVQQQMDFQYQSAHDAMRFSAEEAEKNRQFQKMMSDTAYQRAMADMKAAGLNPILAAQNGGASTPSGSSANGVSMSGASAHSATAQVFQEGLADVAFGLLSSIATSAEKYVNTTDWKSVFKNRYNNLFKEKSFRSTRVGYGSFKGSD